MRETKSIRQWPVEDRPREKLIQFGVENLSNTELVAILLGSGTKDQSALELAKCVVQTCGGLCVMGRMTSGALSKLKGIGPAKSASLIAAFQLGARYSSAVQEEDIPVIRSPEDASRVFGARIRDLNHEVCKVILLNQANHAYMDFNISVGSLNASIVHPREVFKPAIDHLAAAIILMHNHPSGELIPSRQDIDVTEKIVETGRIIDIQLLDHIIVSRKGFVSLKQEGYIQN